MHVCMICSIIAFHLATEDSIAASRELHLDCGKRLKRVIVCDKSTSKHVAAFIKKSSVFQHLQDPLDRPRRCLYLHKSSTTRYRASVMVICNVKRVNQNTYREKDRKSTFIARSFTSVESEGYASI